MANKTPLKFAYDNTTPSALAEFVASDTVSVGNGGTGVSSLDLLGNSLSGTGISASSVSATHVSAVSLSSTSISAFNSSATHVSAVSLSSTNISSFHVSASHVSAVSLSSTSITVVDAMPYPAPFAYIQLTADDTASADEKQVGYSNTPTSVVSNAADISKNFVIHKAGTYECVGRLFFEGGSTLLTVEVRKEASPVNTATPRVHTTVDPVERTISAIFTAAATDVVDITYDSGSGQTQAAQIGTTVTVKRLK